MFDTLLNVIAVIGLIFIIIVCIGIVCALYEGIVKISEALSDGIRSLFNG